MKVLLVLLCLQQLVVAAETLILPLEETALEQTVVWSPVTKFMWDAYTAEGDLRKLDPPNVYVDGLGAMKFDAELPYFSAWIGDSKYLQPF